MKFLYILTALNLVPVCLSFWGLNDADVLKKKVAAIAPVVYLPTYQDTSQSKKSDTSATLNSLPVTSYNYQFSPLIQYPLNPPYFRPYSSPTYSSLPLAAPLNQASYYITNSQNRQPIPAYNSIPSVPYPSQSFSYTNFYQNRPAYQPVVNPVYQLTTQKPLNQTTTSTSTTPVSVIYPTVPSTTGQTIPLTYSNPFSTYGKPRISLQNVSDFSAMKALKTNFTGRLVTPKQTLQWEQTTTTIGTTTNPPAEESDEVTEEDSVTNETTVNENELDQ